MQKENPNPTIHATNKRSLPSQSSKATLLGSAAIHRYHLGGSPSPYNDPASEWEWEAVPDGEDLSHRWGSITADERSVALALSAAAYPIASASNYHSSTQSSADSESPKLDILQQAGFALYHPRRIHKQCRAIRYPSFAPSAHAKEAVAEEQKRDAITANEVFQIIRNIQDPEHPLTLEQLNVVRIELVEVVDLKGENVDGEFSQASGSCRKKFSTVHVQFT
jgi:hypothetical protein